MVNGGEMSLKAACCACLTELVVNDANGQQTVQNNGIYLLAMLLIQPITTCRRHHVTAAAAAADKPDAATVQLQVTSLTFTLLIIISTTSGSVFHLSVYPRHSPSISSA